MVMTHTHAKGQWSSKDRVETDRQTYRVRKEAIALLPVLTRSVIKLSNNVSRFSIVNYRLTRSLTGLLNLESISCKW